MNNIEELEMKVAMIIKAKQEDQDRAIIRLKDGYPNVKSVSARTYNVSNLFAEIGLRDQRNFYSNLKSNRPEFNDKSKSYFKIVTTIDAVMRSYRIEL